MILPPAVRAAILIAALTAPRAPIAPRIVRLQIVNHSRLPQANVEGMRSVASRIWAQYGVDVEFGWGPGAVIVELAADGDLAPSDPSVPVLGTTQFTDGHAIPMIRLSPPVAEALAAEAEIGVIPFRALSPEHQDAVLERMLGVALAHELAHYLLDTRQHSSRGLLRERFTTRELAFPEQGRLTLTVEQQRLLYPDAMLNRRK